MAPPSEINKPVFISKPDGSTDNTVAVVNPTRTELMSNLQMHDGPCRSECKCNAMLLDMTKKLLSFSKVRVEKLSINFRNYYSTGISYLFHRKSNMDLKSLLIILEKGTVDTPCWTIDRVSLTFSNGAYSGKSCHPHEMFYKCWRNSILKSTDKLYSELNCKFGDGENLPTVCINPFHYTEREVRNHPLANLLKTVSSINNPQEKTFWKRESVQNEFFTILSKLLGEELTQKFINACVDKTENSELRQSCFAVYKKGADNLNSEGQIRIQQCLVHVQHVLYKMFRNNLDPLGRIIIQSAEKCRTSLGETRKIMMCLNPWHFEHVNPIVEEKTKSDTNFPPKHDCQPRLRVNLGSVAYVCRICFKDQDEKNQNNPPSLVLNPADIVIKSEPMDIDDKQLEEELRNIGDSLRVDIKEETQEIIPEQVPPPEPETPKEDTILTPKTNNSVRKSTEIVREKSTRKRKIQNLFQCWKCQISFGTNTELKSHICTVKNEEEDEEDAEKDIDEVLKDISVESSSPVKKCVVSISPINIDEIEDLKKVFTCQLCGFCCQDSVEAKKHVDRCRLLGLSRLLEIKKFICEKCSVEFADDAELNLHGGKRKCKSIQCGICNKFYANNTTHQNHSCEGLKEEDPSDDIHLKVDKLSDKSTQPVTCQDCGLLVRSKTILEQDHLTQRNHICKKCEKSFESICKFVSHPCYREDD